MARHVPHQAVVNTESFSTFLTHEAFLACVCCAVKLQTGCCEKAAATFITKEGLDATVDALMALQLAALLEGALALLADKWSLPRVNLHQWERSVTLQCTTHYFCA